MGIWHETYAVPAGRYEAVYVNMPPYGLGSARGTEPVGRRVERAAERMSSGGVEG
ncbi:monooxygenase family protein [Streptomyces ovatisporus]|uniref:Monooxygenase family protein n=1 Tax=Streptomyces ovatisporus TaxID=1128682 RepID=A0ABV9A5I4_9ACTN